MSLGSGVVADFAAVTISWQADDQREVRSFRLDMVKVCKIAGPVRSDGFGLLGAECLCDVAASLSPAVAGVSTLRRP